jgi:hypothetical protein
MTNGQNKRRDQNDLQEDARQSVKKRTDERRDRAKRQAIQGTPKYPPGRTGGCIGQSILPISGIYPVKKGRNSARANSISATVKR